ncbi:hypothetical protein RND71_041591 [Anisodus tanguticus]|uniref:Agamous-like MADS-box protein AGL62 n=1 Tax=Anisodus tanguticus TaxID=243964 RepID=A0AAE1QVP5_9SOLA|nr:hypothetical protein RND71_041591 [Anisodus tanguticus]
MNTNAVKKTQGRRNIAIKPIDNQSIQSLKRQRLFTFGHPSADSVIDRYLNGKSSSSTVNQLNMQQNNQYYSQICRELEVEKKKKESIQESKMVNNNNYNEGFWWNEQVDGMGIDQLEEFMSALGELKKKVTMRADELSMINGSSSSNSSMKIARFK